MRPCLLTVLLILALSGAYANAQDQNLEITKGIQGPHIFPQLAVDPQTGNIVAVWIRLIDQDNSVIMARLLKRTKKGTYRAKKAYEVAASENRLLYTLALAYVPDRERFLVVWSDIGFFDGVLPRGDLYGRELKSKAKPRKKPFTIIADGYGNLFPRLVSIPPAGLDPQNTRTGLILCWTALPTSTDMEGGMRAQALVGNKYKAAGKQITLEKIPLRTGVSPSDSVLEDDLAKIPVPFHSTASNSFGVLSSLSLRNLSDNTDSSDLFSRVFWLNVSDSGRLESAGFREQSAGFAHPMLLLPRPDTPAVPLQVIGVDFSSFSFARKTFNPQLSGSAGEQRITSYTESAETFDVPGALWSPEDGNYLMLTALAGQNQALFGAAAPAADSRIGQFIWTEEEDLYSVALLRNGAVTVDQQPVSRVRHGGALAALSAVGVPGTSTVAVIWRKDILEKQTSEIWLHVFK